MRAGCEGGGKSALLQTEKSGTLACHNDQALFTATPSEGESYPCILTSQLSPATREKVWSLQGNAVDRDVGMNGSGIYEMSDEEKAMQDGSHEVFKKEVQA